MLGECPELMLKARHVFAFSASGNLLDCGLCFDCQFECAKLGFGFTEDRLD